ncbi:MAG: hypothetical protein M0007_16605 [Actinomycetota bacterium]|jgi:hypothetical protein|nr:hypothetical protein [Actinomycetota bacterium]
MDIEQFYDQDERRRNSAEVEFGTQWFDAKGSRYELSWVEDTGELYAMLELAPEAGSWTPFGDVEVDKLPASALVVSVVGVIPDRATVEQVLDGWQDEMGKPDGIHWVADRLRSSGFATSAD